MLAYTLRLAWRSPRRPIGAVDVNAETGMGVPMRVTAGQAEPWPTSRHSLGRDRPRRHSQRLPVDPHDQATCRVIAGRRLASGRGGHTIDEVRGHDPSCPVQAEAVRSLGRSQQRSLKLADCRADPTACRRARLPRHGELSGDRDAQPLQRQSVSRREC